MLKIGSEKDFDIVDGHGHPYVVVVYEASRTLISYVVGPFQTFAKATLYCDTYPWPEDRIGIVEILYPPDVVWP